MSVPVVLYLNPDNTLLVQLTGLMDATTGLYANSAEVTATLFDQRGNPDPVFDDIVLDYQNDTNGNYQGIVPASFSPPAFTGQNPLGGYKLQITAVIGATQAVWTIPAIIQYRSS